MTELFLGIPRVLRIVSAACKTPACGNDAATQHWSTISGGARDPEDAVLVDAGHPQGNPLDPLDDLAGLLRRVRRCAGMNQRELAAALGVSHSLIGEWEAGKGSQMGVHTLQRILRLADLHPARLAEALERREKLPQPTVEECTCPADCEETIRCVPACSCQCVSEHWRKSLRR